MGSRHNPRVPNIITEIRLAKTVLALASARIIFESLEDNGSLSVGVLGEKILCRKNSGPILQSLKLIRFLSGDGNHTVCFGKQEQIKWTLKFLFCV